MLARIEADETLGSKKSSGGVVWRYLLGASWRNARAAEDGLECTSCKQLLVIDRVAMFLLIRKRP